MVVHNPRCAEVRGLLLTKLSRTEILDRYPNGRPHHACMKPGDSEGVIEAVNYPAHQYKKSSNFPDDATRELCEFCSGTHGSIAQVTLPPGVARNLDSTKFR